MSTTISLIEKNIVINNGFKIDYRNKWFLNYNQNYHYRSTDNRICTSMSIKIQ